MPRTTKDTLPTGIERLPSGSYRASVTLRGGGRLRQSFETVDEAVSWRATERVIRSKRGKGGRPSRAVDVAGVTVGDYWPRWLETADLDPKTTVPMYEANYRNHIGPGIGNVPVAQVTARVLDHFAVELRTRSGLAQSTQARVMGMVSAMLGAAVRDGLLESNPSAQVSSKRKTIKAGEIRALEPWEFDKILAESSGQWHAIWLLLGHTGLRWSELAGLQVFCVDVETRTIRVSQQVDREDGTIKPATKDRDPRTVAVPQRAWEALEPYVIGRDPGAFVFTAERGGPLRYANVRHRQWRPMIEALGLRDRSGKLLGIHVLRHSCASWMARGGVAPIDVMGALGHESLRTTMRYFHALDGSARRAASVFDD